MENKRVIVVVIDSLGVGSYEDSKDYGDDGTNTLSHIFSATEGKYKIPNLQKMGLCNLTEVMGNDPVDNPTAYYGKFKELSVGKDTMTGHWEIMGVHTTKPAVTFTDTGFPQELIDELEKRTGHKFIGNYSASGTEIIKDLGERQLETKEMIIYTSADSVLQIAAHEELYGIDEIYRVCSIAREMCSSRPDWMVGRIIARPFVGTNKDNFTRTANRHDYALSPSDITVLDNMKKKGYGVISIGKINDIFNTMGITRAIKSESSEIGMKQTIDYAKENFNGILFTNLVDFDAKWGHRRNPEGYAKELVTFDNLLPQLLDNMRDDDVLYITADHGNDPTWTGSDHTKEMIPVLVYSKSFKEPKELRMGDTFADIGATIAEQFNVEKPKIGTSFLSDLK
ncbi:MAG: phosphopentomutase [Erysipelotrichaceae bacterium]|nr:phosphopentomutase [Erysipelotrichaceae bacterium]